MIKSLYENGLLDEFIKDGIDSNNKKYQMKKEYYDGEQWAVSGIVTKNGMSAIDSRKLNKQYSGIVDNKIKDAIDTFSSLTYGVEGTKIIGNEEIKINWEEVFDKMVIQGLLFERCFFGIGLNGEGKVNLKVFDTDSCLYIKNEEGELTEFVEVKDIDKKRYNSYSKEFDGIYFRKFEDGTLIHEEQREIFPVFECYFGFDLISQLIPSQDYINITKTQEFEVNKYSGDPLTQISGIKMINEQGKQINPKALGLSSGDVIITDTEGQVKRIGGEGITQNFKEAIEREEKNFYRLAKLGALKSENLNGVVSGYSILLKMTDTISFVKKIRGKILGSMSDVFKIFDDINGEESFEIHFGKIIDTGLKEKIEEAKGLKELGYSEEEIRNFLNIG